MYLNNIWMFLMLLPQQLTLMAAAPHLSQRLSKFVTFSSDILQELFDGLTPSKLICLFTIFSWVKLLNLLLNMMRFTPRKSIKKC